VTDAPSGAPKSLLSPAALDFVRPDAPTAKRMAAASGEAGLSPADRLAALAVLAADRDPSIRQAAREQLARGPAVSLLEGLSRETDPRILDILARARGADPEVAEALLRHPAVPDTALARLAVHTPASLLAAVQDRAVPRQQRARIAAAIARAEAAAAHGRPVEGSPPRDEAEPAAEPPKSEEPKAEEPEADPPKAEQSKAPEGSKAPPPDEGDVSEEDLDAIAAAAAKGEFSEEFDPSLTEDGEELPEGSEKKESLYTRILGMTVSQKVQLAFKGNKEARGILVKDSNKLVCGSVIKSPRVTETEIVAFANSRNLGGEVFRLIAANRDYTKLYQVRLALAGNPRVPAEVAVRCLNTLNEFDVASLAKSRNVSSVVQSAARRMVQAKADKQRKKEQALSGGGH
jgi:hypothetical protein